MMYGMLDVKVVVRSILLEKLRKIDAIDTMLKVMANEESASVTWQHFINNKKKYGQTDAHSRQQKKMQNIPLMQYFNQLNSIE